MDPMTVLPRDWQIVKELVLLRTVRASKDIIASVERCHYDDGRKLHYRKKLQAVQSLRENREVSFWQA